MIKVVFFVISTLLIFSLSSCNRSSEQDEIIKDEAFILQNKAELLEQYTEFNEFILKDFDIDFRVITTISEENIDVFTNTRFNALKTRSKSGKTILLVINILQDTTRLEVSMALEHIYTDAFISYIERKGMVPYFKDSKVADGIYMMSELIRDRAYEASQDKEFLPSMINKSIGAGAKTEAKIGEEDTDAKSGRNITSSSIDTPQDVLNKYFNSLKEHNKNPNLDIFTDDTKKFFSTWTVTDINQDNELRFTSSCNKGKYYSSKDKYTVLVHPLKPRTCSPYLFKKESGSWKLDIFTMAKVIRFNKDMLWHFDMNEKVKYLSEYEFGFSNLKYDENGYPFYKKRKKLRWGFSCGDWSTPNESQKNRCWISWLDENSGAKNNLGLMKYDRIVAIGYGSDELKDPTQNEFLDYMKYIPKDDRVIVKVIRNEEIKELRAVAP